MGLRRKDKGDPIGDAIERDYMAEQRRQNAEAKAYVKKHGLEDAVGRSVDNAMKAYKEGWRN